MNQRLRILLLILCVSICIFACEALLPAPAGAAPADYAAPEGKAKGEASPGEWDLSGIYLCEHHGYETDYYSCYLYPEGQLYQADGEPARIKIAFLNGDKSLIDMFRITHNDYCDELVWNTAELQANGKEATFRMDMESEHYYDSFEFTVRMMALKDLVIDVNPSINAITGEPLYAFDIISEAFATKPAVQCSLIPVFMGGARRAGRLYDRY